MNMKKNKDKATENIATEIDGLDISDIRVELDGGLFDEDEINDNGDAVAEPETAEAAEKSFTAEEGDGVGVEDTSAYTARLKINHLSKRYANSEYYSVRDLSLELRPGEVFGFLGKNGAGKSTTIKCLTGILPFDEGNITICGYDIMKEPIQAKMNMGYVPDNHSVYERLTGREYVNYVADLYRVPKAAREERLNMFLDLFKLRFAVDRQIKSYSHGMKQKICIIAALIYEPKLWVLDEPMMGLDPQSTAEILSYMREHVKKGNTVFFSSHNLDMVAKVCNRVAIINDGILHCVIDLSDPANRETLEKRFFEISSTEEERRAWNV